MATQTPVRSEPLPQGLTPPPERRASAGAVILGVVLIGAGTLWLLAALGVDIPVAVVTPVVLISLGLAVVVSAVRGEDHAAIGLAIFVGIWLAIGATVTTVVDVPLTGAVGEHDLAPVALTELEDDYRLFAGSQVLDLRDMVLTAGTTEVSLSTVLGEIDVVVPESMAVRVDASVAGGSIDLDGDAADGLGLDDVMESDNWADAPQRLDLELRVGLGEVRVRSE